MRCLPLDVLRTFVAIVETGSMVKASDAVCLSQSALSLRISRLEALIQRPLFIREKARLTLTPAGILLLDYARRLLDINDRALAALVTKTATGPLRVGVVEDFADSLTAVLARFADIHPDILLEVKVARTQKLFNLVASDDLDVAVGFGDADDPRIVRRASILWIGSTALTEREVLPLALLDGPCLFRNAAIEALTSAGIAYRIVLEASNLATLRSAVAVGLGVTCRAEIFGEPRVMSSPALPPLPHVSCVVAIRRQPSATVIQLADLIKEALLR